MDFIGLYFNKTHSLPLYYQLYNYLLAEIQSGRLAAGEKIPPKRSAAQQLGLSINTIDTAYQMLVAEGYITSKPRSGFVVSQFDQLVPLPKLALNGSKITSNKEKLGNNYKYSFSSGGIDVTTFPQKIWNRIFREVLSSDTSLFHQGNSIGDIELRQAIAEYLRSYRGVKCSADAVIVGAGLEVLTGMLYRLFPNKTVAVETPGYVKSARIVENMGLKVLPVSIDSEGMVPALLRESKGQIAYLTPSHQFPTGTVMQIGRRTVLLQWAAEEQNLIIEDDYDSEFRFDGRPLPCLQGLDVMDRVVYAGTFSRVLAPGLRAAYLVLPEKQLAVWKAAYGDYACTISRPEQHTLANFINGGHFSRHLNRVRSAYKKRRNLLIKEINQQLTSIKFAIKNEHTGLYFILHLPEFNALKVAAKCRENKIQIHAVEEYFIQKEFMQTANKNTSFEHDLIVGYGGLHEEEIPLAVSGLYNSIINTI